MPKKRTKKYREYLGNHGVTKDFMKMIDAGRSMIPIPLDETKYYDALKKNDYKAMDKLYEEYLKKNNTEIYEYLQDRKAGAEAYNQFIEDKISNNEYLYRFVNPDEVIQIGTDCMFRERVEYIDDGVENKTGNNEGIKRTKSFTFNLNHKYSTYNKIKLEMRAKDLPFKILKATAFLRNSKTIKHGQKMDLEDVKQLELRLIQPSLYLFQNI